MKSTTHTVQKEETPEEARTSWSSPADKERKRISVNEPSLYEIFFRGTALSRAGSVAWESSVNKIREVQGGQIKMEGGLKISKKGWNLNLWAASLAVTYNQFFLKKNHFKS